MRTVACKRRDGADADSHGQIQELESVHANSACGGEPQVGHRHKQEPDCPCNSDQERINASIEWCSAADCELAPDYR